MAQESATPVPTPSPGPVVDPGITPEAAEEEPFFHTVEPGDLLASIASKYNVPADVIIRANPDLDVNLILVGQQLRIPGASTNSELLENVGPDRADNVVATYLIEPGDTLGEIADTWTVTVDALQAANPDVDPANLQVNQLLTIPPWGSGFDASELESRTTPVPIQRDPGGPALEHVVEAGDFLSALAETYSVTTTQIVVCNNLENNGNNIQVGQVLLIPPPGTEACQ